MARGPTVRYVKDYAVQELLGKGAFGCVYQAKKDTGETLFAMKELPLDMVSVHGGGSGEELRDSDGEQSATLLEREVQILSTLQHPNIIRYYDSFQQGDSFYIVMELVEGATLLDHLNSLSEKRQSMAEPRIWQLFTQVCAAVLAFHSLAGPWHPPPPHSPLSPFLVQRPVAWPRNAQMCLALRYIHKEKHVVHRDLTPSNIMITAEGDIKLADFGLAKERTGTGSVMESVVGTVLYQCPEIIQAEAYGEKADIWSLGCILYQTAMLRPPFQGGNPLVVARSIVEGTYAPLDDGYSELMARVIPRLLCVKPEQRPDIDEVAQMISPLLVSELERVRKAEHELRAEVSMERDWRQRHEREASRNKEAVHRLFARHQLDAHSRTNSCVARESSREASPMSPHRRAPLAREPRSPMLSISPNRIREINDPCSRILNQLHKILFISQLPPSMEGELSAQRQVPTQPASHRAGGRNARAHGPTCSRVGGMTGTEPHRTSPFWQVVEKYKRALFSHRRLAVHQRGWNLKDELNKLVSGSQEVINLTFYSPTVVHGDAKGASAVKQRITYEELQHFIEQVLSETGYYSCQPAGDDSVVPLSDLADADRPAPSDRGVHVWPESQPRTRLSQHHLPPMQRPVCNNSSGLASESKPTLLATTRSCELLHAP